MTSQNTTNYKFLKNFKPELYKLAVKMEEDLLIAPVSILAYATRFLEYILYDLAKYNDYEVNRESGFVKNIYELIQLDYLEYYLGDLLIKAYVFRNTSIHNTDITKSLKEDRKNAFELNKRLFDIADVYYKNLTNNYEEHVYVEPKVVDESQNEVTYIVKQDKIFDKCIICGESNKLSKSNFCIDCDKLLNYRDVLAKIVADRGTDVLLKRNDIDYPFKDQLIKDLLDKNIFKRIGNDLKIVDENLDDLFKLTDKFMEIDEFLTNFIKNPKDFKADFPYEYPYLEIPSIVDNYYIENIVSLCEHGFSYKKALQHVDVRQSNLNNWYDDKKSEFLDGNKDDLFVKYNELLIENLFKSLKNLRVPEVNEEYVEFWIQYFDNFAENLSKNLSKLQLRLFFALFKTDTSREHILNQLDITIEELENHNINNSLMNEKSIEEMERRKRLMLVCIDDNFNFKESLEKSKLDIEEYEKSREDFLNGIYNEFYDKLSKKIMRKYLNLRRIGKTTHEICEKLAIAEEEVETWLKNDLFKEFHYSYDKIRLTLLKQATTNQKGIEDILKELEMNGDEFEEFIKLGSDGDENYVGFVEYFNEEYYPNMMTVFLEEFRKTLNLNLALKNTKLSKEDLKTYLYVDEELYHEFIQIKIDKIVSTTINKGKYNDKLLKKLGISKNEFLRIEDEINENVAERQLNFIINEVSNGEIMLTTCKKVNCDIDAAFDWIYEGTLGDEEFNELAEVYWDEHLLMINHINSELRDYNIDHPSRNKILTANMKYDFKYWMKWGLISQDNEDLSIEDVKKFLRNYEN